MRSRALAGVALVLILGLGACDENPVAPGLTAGTPSASNHAPIAVVRVAWSGQEGAASAGFTAKGSSDPDGDSLYYTWDFGDSTTLTTTYVARRHDYADNGSYTVKLTVTDIHGATGFASTQVSISNTRPVILAAILHAPAMPAPLPVAVTLHLEIWDAGSRDHPVATIDWGDGTTSQDTVHSYQNAGVFQPRVTVTDKDGASSDQNITNANRFASTVWTYDPAQSHPTATGYEAVDIGTLGGDETRPASLNDRGEVVGWGTTDSGTAHAFLWRDGSISDLTPPGLAVPYATVTDASGWIAGPSMHNAGQLPRWRDGNFIGFLPVPTSEYGAWPVKIAESGDVLLNVEGHEFPDATLMRGTTAIRLVSGTHAGAVDMNSHEQVIGWVGLKFIGEGVAEAHGFFWDNGVFKDLGSIGTENCWWGSAGEQCGGSDANDINDQGQIVGASFDGHVMRAVVWDGDSLSAHDLGFGSGSEARAINEKGQIAGDTYGKGDAYFRDNDQLVTLGSLGGGGTRVVAMNEQGVVVGTSLTAGGQMHAFVWSRATGMRDLGTGPFGSLGIGSIPIGIDPAGNVAGYVLPCPAATEGYCNSWSAVRGIVWRSTMPSMARRN